MGSCQIIYEINKNIHVLLNLEKIALLLERMIDPMLTWYVYRTFGSPVLVCFLIGKTIQ